MTQAQDEPPARGADILPFPSRRPASPAPEPAPPADDGDDGGPSAA